VIEVIIRRRRRRRRIRRRKILCKNNSLPRRKVGRGSLNMFWVILSPDLPTLKCFEGRVMNMCFGVFQSLATWVTVIMMLKNMF
jgi:hypothetical protein